MAGCVVTGWGTELASIVITGANTGIGKVTARELARQGHDVLLACRSAERTEPVVEELRRETGNDRVDFVPLDLADLASVRRAAQSILDSDRRIDVLINNAGLAGQRGLTVDGFELAFGVNHLGHFLLTNLLLERLVGSAPARVVNVASRAHFRARDGIDFGAVRQPTRTVTGYPEYTVSKLANVLHARALSKRLAGKGVHTYSLHPGVVASDVWRRVPWPFRSLMKLFMISNEEGAKTSLYCATAEACAEETGLYYDECVPKTPSRHALDDGLAEELWERSVEWTGASP